jgi:hypothetical protein
MALDVNGCPSATPKLLRLVPFRASRLPQGRSDRSKRAKVISRSDPLDLDLPTGMLARAE